MTAFTAASGAGLLAHGVHWLIVLGGTAGMLALVLPAALDRLAPRLAPRLSPPPAAPRDEHERRVHEVRVRLLAGAPSGVPTGTPFFPADARADTLADTGDRPGPSSAACLTLPLALVAGTAAAGVHAAVGAAHLGDQPALGGFFLLCALGQLGWAALAPAGTGPALLRAAAVGNAALVLVWAVSRTVGLPDLGPLAGGTEPVGTWDLLAAGWEVVVVLACGRLLAAAPLAAGTRVPGWRDWHPAARRFLVGSALVLALTSLAGVPA
ncbi:MULTISPECIES: hypothetical protein [unclassified Nocardioides]|uniref:hypothetical protein n=1 Tax=unclassified Nocardioides TaxID=2615069 RepID=UPI0026654673|nr:hypothetical protein [Nocardioides sp. Arc9.136]WKN48197.1 hypothetical protein OSR43_19470 [Nocardioides sp. Arc9.136]